ncbi:MAG: helix-turn-helix domain-containing protein [Anaerolineae bacterium]|nr:helix-turn-helix domain-containing protein [Anaerolineae bacterium]
MQDVLYIEDVDRAMTLLHPLRIDLLKRMDEPRTCPDLARAFDTTPQKIYYHVKALEKAGLVEKTAEKRVRGAVEGYYQARARSYWLAPKLVGQIGGEKTARDQTSLRFLLSLAEEIHNDVGRLGQSSAEGTNVPSMGMSAHVYLPDGERRAAFLSDVQQMFQTLARKYGIPPDDADDELIGQAFRLILACYPSDSDKR